MYLLIYICLSSIQVFPTVWERETRPGTEAMLVCYEYIQHLAKLTFNSGLLFLGLTWLTVCIFNVCTAKDLYNREGLKLRL